MPTARVNGVDLHYQVSGEGPTVVWLHGLLNSIERARMLGEGMERLAERGFRLVLYDARGHGASGGTNDPAHYTWEAHARDLAALLDHLGIERAIVGGGSMGAGVSITLALAQPQRLERLVLLAPPPLADTIDTARQIFGGLASLIEALGVERAVEIVMELPPFAELRNADPQRYDLLRRWLLGVRADAATVAIRGLLNGPPLPADRFGEITVPTLIVGQPDDPIHPISTAERLHEAIAGSRLVVAPTMDYYRERPEKLLETVVEFLRGS